ncbi:MAG TPA: nucleoside phosphorylase [Clostridiaceae bacterium]|nr:nucleoside phosphorylase [Clostridiaceae bacterium]
MIYKHALPILEYDDQKNAVIDPDHEQLNLVLPERAVFAFLGDTVEAYARAHGARLVSFFDSITKQYPIFILSQDEGDICLCQAPVGAPAAAQILDWLIAYGCRKIISAGSCGVLEPLEENSFMIPVKALRDEGTSYHYLPPSRFIELNSRVISIIEKVLTGYHVQYNYCVSWTTDAFFRETPEMVSLRMQEGCQVVDMECSALASVAAFRGVEFGQVFFSGDTLANVQAYDSRNFGADSLELAMELAVAIAEQL